jgi:hypothetical protein
LLDGGDALAGVGEQPRVAREQQVGVGLVLEAADAAAELVQFAQAEAVGAIDDDRVAFGISRPLSMIVVQTSTSASPLTKSVITSSSSSASIWPWPTTMRAFGQQLAAGGHEVDGEHAVVEEENLPAAVQISRWMASMMSRSS